MKKFFALLVMMLGVLSGAVADDKKTLGFLYSNYASEHSAAPYVGNFVVKNNDSQQFYNGISAELQSSLSSATMEIDGDGGTAMGGGITVILNWTDSNAAFDLLLIPGENDCNDVGIKVIRSLQNSDCTRVKYGCNQRSIIGIGGSVHRNPDIYSCNLHDITDGCDPNHLIFLSDPELTPPCYDWEENAVVVDDAKYIQGVVPLEERIVWDSPPTTEYQLFIGRCVDRIIAELVVCGDNDNNSAPEQADYTVEIIYGNKRRSFSGTLPFSELDQYVDADTGVKVPIMVRNRPLLRFKFVNSYSYCSRYLRDGGCTD